MPEIKRVYGKSLPAMRFVGRCYLESERTATGFSISAAM